MPSEERVGLVEGQAFIEHEIVRSASSQTRDVLARIGLADEREAMIRQPRGQVNENIRVLGHRVAAHPQRARARPLRRRRRWRQRRGKDHRRAAVRPPENLRLLRGIAGQSARVAHGELVESPGEGRQRAIRLPRAFLVAGAAAHVQMSPARCKRRETPRPLTPLALCVIYRSCRAADRRQTSRASCAAVK